MSQNQNQQRRSPVLLLLLWLGLAFLLFRTGPTSKPPTTSSSAASQRSTVRPTPRTTGAPIDLNSSHIKARFARDGSVTGVEVTRYHEEILGRSFLLEEDFQKASASTTQVVPPRTSGGLHVGRLPFFTRDENRQSLLTTFTLAERSIRFDTTDPDGRLLPKGVRLIREYTLDSQTHRFSLKGSITNETRDLIDLASGPGAICVYAGPLLVSEGDIPEVFARNGSDTQVVSVGSQVTECTTGTRWLGVRNQYFAVLLDHVKGPGRFVHQSIQYRTISGTSSTGPTIGFRLDTPYLKPGQTVDFFFHLYCGPKVEADLGPDYASVFNNWEGTTGGIGRLMFQLLQFFHSVTGSYGIAILLLTLAVKLLLHPLSFSQTVSMQRMQELQPKLKKLKDQCKDPQELQRQTLKLYQDYNVNPLGGCLPALVQVPIFIALYWCLRGAIELKGVSFWWIKDLSMPDPTTILALVFALSIYLSGKLMQPNAGAGNEQQVMMNKMMPIMMYGMFVFMPVPAGVMIYMATQSLLGVAETRYNLSRLPKKRVPRAGSQGKGGKKADKAGGDAG